jgi:hypothetical protein
VLSNKQGYIYILMGYLMGISIYSISNGIYIVFLMGILDISIVYPNGDSMRYLMGYKL